MVKRTWMAPFGAGLLATAALVGLLLLFSRFTALSFVPLDIADAMIHLTPGAIATQGIETLGPVAKLLIELTGSAIFIAVGGVVGLLYARLAPRPLAPAGVGLALIPLALTALVQLIGGGLRGGPLGLGLTALLYLLWGFVLVWMVNRLVVPAPTPAEPADGARRTFLFASSGALLAVAVGSTAIAQLLERSGQDGAPVAGAGQALPTSAPAAPTAAASPTAAAAAPTAAAATAAQPTSIAAGTAAPAAPTVAPTPAPTAEPTPVPFVPAPGTRSPFNTNETLYVISSATRDPVVDKDLWKLEVGGAVNAPFSLSYAELLALPRVDQTSTLECISNEVGN